MCCGAGVSGKAWAYFVPWKYAMLFELVMMD